MCVCVLVLVFPESRVFYHGLWDERMLVSLTGSDLRNVWQSKTLVFFLNQFLGMALSLIRYERLFSKYILPLRGLTL